MRVLKWCIALLVLANFVIYLWPQSIGENDSGGYVSSPVNPESMRLLREPSISRDAEHAAPQIAAAPKVAANCGKIGPFVSQEQLEIARVQLSSLSLAFSENTEPVRSADVLRIYLVAGEVGRGIDTLRSRLNEAGITDHFRMADEDGTELLSLGVYSESERAERVAAEYRDLGFDVLIRSETTRLPERYWLLVGLEGKSSQLIRTLSGMIWGAPGVGFSASPCQI